MMDKNARTKLRNMGGIMASSPELMRVAQGFQVGGPVMPQAPLAPRTSGVTRPGTGAPLVGLGRVPPMMPGQGVPGTAPVMLPESAPGRFVAGQGLDTAVTDSFFGGTDLGEPAFSVDDLLDGSGALSTTPKTEAQQRAERIDALRRNSVEAAAEFVRSLPNPVEALSDYANIFGAEAAGVVSSAVGATETGAKFFETAEAMRSGPERRQDTLAEETADSRQKYFEQGGPSGLSALATPIQTSMDDPEKVERMQTQLQKVIEENQETTDDTDTDTPDGPPPAPSKKDLRSRYKEKLELFKEIYGEKDEDRARDKAMSLAMIGLAIAAGQSPNALTNISQGLSVGLQGMGEQSRARRERDRGLQTLALETAIGEQSAEAEAAARAAEQEAEFQNRLAVANIRAAGGGGAGINKINAASRLLREEISDLREAVSKGGVIVPKGVDEEKFIQDLARKNVDRTLRLQVAQELLLPEEYDKIAPVLGAPTPLKTTGFNAAEQETVNQAKSQLARNPANRRLIAQKLSSVGIDPGVLGDG